MAPNTKQIDGKAPAKKASDISWLARLTHPLVFFGAALAVYEGTVGTALLVGKHSDATVITLCLSMAVVIVAVTVTVAILVFKKPQNLMLMQQHTIEKQLEDTTRIRRATALIMTTPKPRSGADFLRLTEQVEAILSGSDV
ncbi:hypothetical protein [Granulicella paludicola]|uniref:hypothetical protein n=1 Tax=Granulicella paludicola TaxID=474951 RepID=UPI0021DFD324|nr:hypothetical protein [Granulicella paludicola]